MNARKINAPGRRRSREIVGVDLAPVKRLFDVWELRSVDGKQVVTSVQSAYPGSTKYQNEFQRLIAQVHAYTKAEAQALALSDDAAKHARRLANLPPAYPEHPL